MRFLIPRNKLRLVVGGGLILVSGLLLAVFATQKQQDIRQRASEPVSTTTTVPSVWPLGRATAVNADPNVDCRLGDSSFPTSGCYKVTINNCPYAGEVIATVRVSTPPQPKGTIMFTVGGGGDGFYHQYGGTSARNYVLKPLFEQGFQIVDPKFDIPWFPGTGEGQYGLRGKACAHATLLNWVHENIYVSRGSSGGFCATGASGGASALGFDMTSYKAEEILDGVLFTGGPPLNRIDHGCLGETDPAWASQCRALTTCVADRPACGYDDGHRAAIDKTYGTGVTACQTRDLSWSPTWQRDSITGPGADLHYPNTPVRFIFGARDCGEGASAQGKLYANAITSSKMVTVIPDVGHNVQNSPEGGARIVSDLSQMCATGSPSQPTPTTIRPTSTHTPVPTHILTPTPTRVSTPTPTITPTTALSPPATLVPGGTRLSFTLLLHGLGRGGDSANPNGVGNINPLRRQRPLIVELFNSKNQLVLTRNGTISYNPTPGNFTGIVDIGNTLSTGAYTVKVKTTQFLKSLVPGIQTITQGTVNLLPSTTLVSGDIDSNNQINILDYNILIGCYSDFLPPVSCATGNKELSDLHDDGNVNQFDYNLFLRELTNIQGQ
ncbi:MAG TPA: hypothetical protein VNA13_02790 [Xanthomonadales bacterium]|nr:hypothetical protein [Xanthomonadales bacterium]